MSTSPPPPGLADFVNQQAPTGATQVPPGLEEFLAPEIQEAKYGTAGQQLKTFAESAAKDATFGLSVPVEKAFGVKPEDIRARAETNPGTAIAGSMTGLVASSLTPMGEGALLARAGEAGASRLIPKAVTTLDKIGSSAAKGIIENAIYSAGDEVSKAFANDPDQTVASALTNIGLGAAIGGVAGGAFGAVSPLWDATMGPKANAFLSAIKDRADGKTLPASSDFEAVAKALSAHGIDVPPEMRTRFANDPNFAETFQALRESGLSSGEAIRGAVEKFKGDTGELLKDTLYSGEPVSAFDAGETAKADFLKTAQRLDEEVDAAYEPLRKTEKSISISESDRTQAQDALNELGSKFGAKGSPQVATFERFGERIRQQETLQDVKKLITELNNEWGTLTTDKNTKAALNEIRGVLRDFEDKQVEKAFSRIAKDTTDPLGADGMAKKLNAERKAARDKFGRFMDTLGEMSSVGRLGKIRSLADLDGVLKEVPSAKLADKLFDKKNIEGLRYLEKNFPETLSSIVKQKKSQILESATSKGEVFHNKILDQVNRLPKEIKPLMFTKEELGLIDASGKVLREINVRNNPSGTARSADKNWKHMSGGVGAIVGALSGHGLGAGYMIGEAARLLGRDAPETVKLSMLKFLGSTGPVDSGAWKAAADFIHHAQKGQKLIESSVKNVFRAGRDVLPSAIIPSDKETKRLDKRIAEFSVNPEKMLDIGGKTSHYLPDQAQSLAKSAAGAVNYLNSVKPKEPQLSAFDTKQEVSHADQAAYNRQLQIAEQPLMVLEHIKSGELQPQDVVAVKTMYPSLYNKLVQSLTNEAIGSISADESVPYHTRLSMALFVGQPLDGTMSPTAIQAAQSSGMVSQAQNQQSQTMHHPHQGSMAKLGKSNLAYQTPGQAREMQRQGKA